MLFGETCKNNITRLYLCADTCKLPELSGAEVGLNGILKRCDQVWNFGDHCGAGYFISQSTQYPVLVICARKATFDAYARQHECAFSIQMKCTCFEDETVILIFGSAAIHRIWQCNIDSIYRVDEFYEGPHVCRCVMIDLYAEVE